MAKIANAKIKDKPKKTAKGVKNAESASNGKSKKKKKTKGGGDKIIVPTEDEIFEFAIKAERVSVVLDEIEKKFDIVSNMIAPRKRVSTGLLCLDYQWHGGLQPGMYQVSGPEASGKTTLGFTTFGNIIRNANLPLTIMEDAEGTAGGDIEYAENLLGLPLDTISGKDNAKRVRLYQENVIERMYDVMKEITRRFPYKVYDADEDAWFYRVKDSQEKKAKYALENMLAMTGASISDCDKRRGSLYLPAPSRIEGVFFVDSYASMVTEREDEADSDDGDGRMAAEAGAFSKNIKRIVAPMANKGFAVFGINQMRENPGNKYGSPWYEPGGNALKFYSSVRERVSALVPGSMHTKACVMFERSKEGGAMGSSSFEPSVEIKGATDHYKYARILNNKNKYGTPYLSSEFRIWFRDGNKKGRGICPVFDTWQFMEAQGLGEYKNKKFFSKWWEGSISWLQFKTLILAEVSNDPKRMADAAKSIKLKKGNIRQRCFDYLRNGKTKIVQGSAGDDDLNESAGPKTRRI